MNMERLYKAGLIGLGRIAFRLEDDLLRPHPATHAGAYAAHPRTQIVAAASRSPQNRTDFAAKFDSQCKLYADWREMLAETPLDLLSICAPAPVHAEMTIGAARSGVRAILCEKPLTQSLEEGDRVLEVCRAEGTILAVNFTRRWSGDYLCLCDLLQRGEIGKLRSINAHFSGNLLHTGTHAFDILRMLAGEPISVYGRLGTVAARDSRGTDSGLEQDVDGSAYFEFEEGVYATVHGHARGFFQFEFEVSGTQGRVRLGNAVAELWKVDSSPRYAGFRELKQCGFPEYDQSNVWMAIVGDLVGCLDQGREPKATGKEGLAAQEMALAVHVSHGLGGPVSFPLEDRSLSVETR